ncbi:MAG: transporter substrate-binding domain-containing protein [Lachnospiraceae bacterium]|nr:transporter substrate-binding domain-containing protein [Lachnospiraceae bacterium]
MNTIQTVHNLKNSISFLFRILLFACLFPAVILFFTGCGKKDEKIPGTVHEQKDLPGKSVGVLTSSQADLYATDLELPSGEEAPSIINRYDSFDKMLADLNSGALDCIITDTASAADCCEKNKNLFILEEAFVWEEYAICLGAEQKQLQKQLNQTLALLEEEGVLTEITERYLSAKASDKTEESDEKSSADDQSDSSNSRETLRVATCSGFQPYVYYDETGELTGIDIDVARALARRLNKKLEIKDMEYESLFTSIADGSADFAIAGISPSEDLMESCLFTDSYTTDCQVILARK